MDKTAVPATLAGCRPLCTQFDALCAQSRRAYRPAFEFPGWPAELDRDQWFTSPELVSLAGTEVWDQLSGRQQRQVSFWDAANFFSANIRGEAMLLRGLAERLYRPGHEPATAYMHHMIDEENKHSIYFAEFCHRYAGKVYPDRVVSLGSDPAEAADFLFFARVMCFEDVVDGFNQAMARDTRLDGTVRWIHQQHHDEERRHLAFGRIRVRQLFETGRRQWSPAVLAQVRSAVAAYLSALWVPLYNPEVYADAGLDDPYALARQAHRSPRAQQLRQRLSRRSVGFLTRSGVLAGPLPTHEAHR